MPLVSMYKVTNNDLIDNKDCIFIYLDHKRKIGDPPVNADFRHAENAYPIIVKKYSGTKPESFFSDAELGVFQGEFDPTFSKIVSILRSGGTGILCRESMEHDDFSPILIREHSKKVHDYMHDAMIKFYSQYKPRLIRKR